MKKNENKISNRYIVFALLLIMSISWMSVISGFSSKNAEESTVQSNRVTEFLIMLFEDDSESLTEEEKQALIEKYDGIVRTAAHFSVFAVLGILTYFTAGSLCWIPDFAVRPSCISFPFCVLFSAADEFHQMFVPGRSFQFKDIATDSVGALCGILTGVLAVIIIRRKNNK